MTNTEASDLVWIRTTVECGWELDEEFYSIPRAKWDAMTPEQREADMTDAAVDHQNNFAPCSAAVVDESEVPEYRKREG
jgi:hypothetical protein